MKQHPIPQNVLDVEFKLFTKLTLKEFAYLAAGILAGSIFLLLNNQAGLPGIIAWPAFLLLSGLGLFFALVPINDQGADEFVKNYFQAIQKPTQRVWLNEQMKENRTKPIINTTTKNSEKKIIGGDTSQQENIPVEKPGDDIFQEKDAVQENTVSKKFKQNNVTNSNSPAKRIIIGPQNRSQYQFNIQSVNKLPGNINIWLTDVNNRGIPNIPTFLKDKSGRVIFANKTGPNGYFLTNQVFPPNVYYIQFENDIYQIPIIELVIGGNEGKFPLKITGELKR
jgi:hypothetical protein